MKHIANRYPAFFAILLLSLSSATACADEILPYGASSKLDLVALLPPPPSADSAEQKGEVNAILATQAAANSARVKLAIADGKGSLFDMFGGLLGARFTPATLPATVHLFDRIGASEAALVGPAQKAFARPRPFAADPRVQVVTSAIMMPAAAARAGGDKLPDSGSWPSGRATRVTASAVILAALLPERAGAIWARAQEYAESRVVAGMHFPGDLTAGYRSGTALAAVLPADPEFQSDLGKARSELRAALGL